MFAQQELDRVSHLATHPCIGDFRNIQGHFHGFRRQPLCADSFELENIDFRLTSQGNEFVWIQPKVIGHQNTGCDVGLLLSVARFKTFS